jgi:hypothetical protein
MNQFEDLLQKETNTDERHTVAAEFFVGLKTAAKMPKHHTSKVTKKVKTKKVDEKLLAKVIKKTRSNKPPKSPVLPKVKDLKGKTKTVFMPIEGRAVAGKTTLSKQRLPIPKALTLLPVKKPLKSGKLKEEKTVYASIEDKKKALIEAMMMEKDAYILTAAKRLLQQGLRGAGKATARAGASAKASAEGVRIALDPNIASRAQLMREGVKRGVEKITPNMPRLKKVLNYDVTKPFRAVGRGAQNFANPRLAKARKAAAKHVDDYVAKNPKPIGVAATPEALKKWEIGMAHAQKDSQKAMGSYRTAKDIDTATGASATIGSLIKSVKDSKGKISPSSIYKGLEDTGLMSPEALMGLGTGAWGAISGARAASLAAKKHNQLMMLGGGAAGLGALALLKGRKSDTRAG